MIIFADLLTNFKQLNDTTEYNVFTSVLYLLKVITLLYSFTY